MLRRHDLVYLDLDSGHQIEVLTEHRSFLEKWPVLNRPFVVGRQVDGDGLLRVGFTMPSAVNVTVPKQRVAVTATFDRVTNHYPPPN